MVERAATIESRNRSRIRFALDAFCPKNYAVVVDSGRFGLKAAVQPRCLASPEAHPNSARRLADSMSGVRIRQAHPHPLRDGLVDKTFDGLAHVVKLDSLHEGHRPHSEE